MIMQPPWYQRISKQVCSGDWQSFVISTTHATVDAAANVENAVRVVAAIRIVRHVTMTSHNVQISLRRHHGRSTCVGPFSNFGAFIDCYIDS